MLSQREDPAQLHLAAGGGGQARKVGSDLRVGLQEPHQTLCLHGQTRSVPSYQHPKAPLLKLEMPLSRLDVPVIRPLRIGQMGNDLGGEAKEAAPGHRGWG